jgi:hypothetical protein
MSVGKGQSGGIALNYSSIRVIDPCAESHGKSVIVLKAGYARDVLC